MVYTSDFERMNSGKVPFFERHITILRSVLAVINSSFVNSKYSDDSDTRTVTYSSSSYRRDGLVYCSADLARRSLVCQARLISANANDFTNANAHRPKLTPILMTFIYGLIVTAALIRHPKIPFRISRTRHRSNIYVARCSGSRQNCQPEH